MSNVIPLNDISNVTDITEEVSSILGVNQSEIVSAGSIQFPTTPDVPNQETANAAESNFAAEESSASVRDPVRRPKPYDKSVEQPFHEHTIPGSKFFFSTAKEITPVDYEKELRRKFDSMPLWLEANTFWDFFGRIVMLHTMAKISMRRGLKHTTIFRDVLREKVVEWATKELKGSESEKMFYTGDEDFDNFRKDAWAFNWEYEKTDSRMAYAIGEEQFKTLAARAEAGGERYEKAFVYIAGEHGFTIKRTDN